MSVEAVSVPDAANDSVQQINADEPQSSTHELQSKISSDNKVHHVDDKTAQDSPEKSNRVTNNAANARAKSESSNGFSPSAKQGSEHQSEGTHKVELIAKDLHATVKWYNGQMHYGFLVRTDTQREVFVHRNSIVMSVGEPPWLNRNQSVTFDLWTLPCGRFDAKNVRSANGQPITFGDPGASNLSGSHRPPLQHQTSPSNQHFRRQQPGFAYGRPQLRMPIHGQYGYYCPVCGRLFDYPLFGGRFRGSFKPLGGMNSPRMSGRT